MTWRRFQAIRGAITAVEDSPGAIREAMGELLRVMIERNAVARDELVSVLFSVTGDLSTEYPARAARELGWGDVSLLCMTEIPVPGSLPRCIRVLMHVERARPGAAVQHVYLRGAAALRPDLTDTPASSRERFA